LGTGVFGGTAMDVFARSEVLKHKLGSDVVIELDAALDAASQEWMKQVLGSAVNWLENRILMEISISRNEMAQRFDNVDRRFEQIDRRFEQIDHRFEQIDHRFEQIDGRFEQIDRRFEKNDGRFDRIDERLYELRREISTQFRWTIGVMMTLVAGVLAAILSR
jgi:predicted nuclease with TOPRIM domain